METKPSAWKVAAVVSFYMVAALVMVFVNKAVLISTPDVPLLFLLIQLVLAVVLLHIGSLFTPKIEIPVLDLRSAKSLIPVVSVNIIGLVFNMLCLRAVEASFFQIARGLVLPLTIAVSSYWTHTKPKIQTVLVSAVITMGFFIGVAPEKSLPVASIPSVISLVYGLLSSLMIALHAVLIKSALPICNNSTIQLAYWTNLGSAILLAPFIVIVGEPLKFMALVSEPDSNVATLIWGSLVTGVFGFLLCVAGLLSIKITSPVTHMVSSAARSVLQTLLGVWIFSDILTVQRMTSLSVILGGTMYYTWLKSTQPAASQSPAQPRDAEAAVSKDGDRKEEGKFEAR
ncbi:hypothetical protein PENSPDRAFT_662079 [Peniophora sp. CONT]|nr:hypothetical protein PENSPDRAFT_662079 [Peniophora sp. CONT]